MKLRNYLLPFAILLSGQVLAFEPPGADGLAKYSSRLDGVDASGNITNANEIVYDIATDDAGNVYVVGSFASHQLRISVNKEIDLETPTGTLTTTNTNSDPKFGGTDIFITQFHFQRFRAAASRKRVCIARRLVGTVWWRFRPNSPGPG